MKTLASSAGVGDERSTSASADRASTRLEEGDAAILAALARAVPGSQLIVVRLGTPSPTGTRRATLLWPAPGPVEPAGPEAESLASPFVPRWGAVLEAGHSLSVTALEATPAERRLLDELGAAAATMLPVAPAGHLWGAVALGAPEAERSLSETDRAVLAAAAACVGAALGRTPAEAGDERAVEAKRTEQALLAATAEMRSSIAALEARNREITLLAEMGRLLQGCRTTAEAHEVAGHFAPQLFPGTAGALLLVDKQRGRLEPGATWGAVERRESPLRQEQCWALRLARLHRTAVDESFRCSHLFWAETVSATCVPLTVQGEPLGVLSIERRDRLPRVGEEHPAEQLATTAAEQVALALTNLRLREILQEQAIQDPLTGLYNRRHMEESLDHELRRAIRKQTSLGVLMLDLDHFKEFNDSFGHEAGDSLLRAFGSFLKARVRAEDVPCRYGGEEFTILLPEAGADVVRRRAEELRLQVGQLTTAVGGGRPRAGVTVSVGGAVFPDNAVSASALLRAADDALYRSKAEGRDRVRMAGDPGEELIAPRSGSIRVRA